jgi:hypothetical protein
MLDFDAWSEKRQKQMIESKAKAFTEVQKPKGQTKRCGLCLFCLCSKSCLIEMIFSINITEHDADIK